MAALCAPTVYRSIGTVHCMVDSKGNTVPETAQCRSRCRHPAAGRGKQIAPSGSTPQIADGLKKLLITTSALVYFGTVKGGNLWGGPASRHFSLPTHNRVCRLAGSARNGLRTGLRNKIYDSAWSRILWNRHSLLPSKT